MRLRIRATSIGAAKVGGLAVMVFVGLGISPDAAAGAAHLAGRMRRWFVVAVGAAMVAIVVAVAAAATTA